MNRQQSHRSLQEPELQPEMIENEEQPDIVPRFTEENYAKLVLGVMLGWGGYGRVYQYQWNGITVAVKDIAVSDKDIPLVNRVCREGEIHKKLRNKNIIGLITTHALPQHLLLVMEFAAGGSLSDVLEEHTSLESSIVTDWAAQIAEGMSYLHDNGIVHRDLKPSNILVLEPIVNADLSGKTIKIADFGLACDGHYETRTMSKPGGTVYFMAPEVREPPHRFSKASDVYSFGMAVWTLLTGKEPAKDPEKSFQLVEMLRCTVSPFYNELLKKCCTSDHLKRPTFTNILADITQWKRRNATESEGISWCNEELDSVLVNFHGSPSLAPASSLQQPSQQQQQAASSSHPTQQQQQQQSFSFGNVSDSFKLPVSCQDVALTQDGRSLLLAAKQHGLIELSSASGLELSRWRSPKLSSGWDDLMLAVAALCDRRAAVSLLNAHLVVKKRQQQQHRQSSG